MPKLGIDVSQSTVAKYMAKRCGSPFQGWRTFLRNHADGIAAIDLVVVPTLGYKLLFGVVILDHDRRKIVHVNATYHPTSEWIARQIVEAFPWNAVPRYLIRDRDASFGQIYVNRLSAMGVRDRLLPLDRRGKMDMWSGSSDPSGESCWITSLY